MTKQEMHAFTENLRKFIAQYLQQKVRTRQSLCSQQRCKQRAFSLSRHRSSRRWIGTSVSL